MSTFKDRVNAQRTAYATKQASFEKAYKFPVGKTVLRILPGVKNPAEFDRRYGAHYIKDLATDAIVAVVGDNEITFGKPDPCRSAIDELVTKANLKGDTIASEKIKKWLARPVNVINAEVVAGPDVENKGKVVRPEFSDTSLDAINSVLQDMVDANENFDADFASKGVFITVERVGTGMNDTRYTFSMTPTQPKEACPQAIMDRRIDLDTYVAGKFGDNVLKALTKLSAMLCKDVTQTALGAAIAATHPAAAIAAPKAPIDEDEGLLTLEAETKAPIDEAIDVDFVDAVVTADVKPAKPVEDDGYADILAELEAL